MAASSDKSAAWVPLAWIVCAGFAAGAFVVFSSQVVGLAAVSLLAIMALVGLCRGLTRWPEDPAAGLWILRWTMAAFGVHLLAGLTIINSRLLDFLGPDALNYDDLAQKIVQHWASGAPLPRMPGGKEGFYYLLASLYWVFGHSTWGGVALNAALGAALIPIVSDTTRRLFGIAAVRYVPVLLLLVPGMLLWPSQLLKEAPFLFLLAAAANCAVRLLDNYSLWPLLCLIVLLPALLLFRAQTGLVVLAAMLAGLVLGRRRLAGGLIGGIVASSLVALVVASGVGSSGYETAVSTDLQTANDVRRGSASGVASGFGAQTDISTTNRALSYLPLGLLSVGVGPFPWQLEGGRQLVALPDMVAWWVLLAGFWWGQQAARQLDRRWLTLTVPALAVMAVIALSVGNYGTVVRERVQVLVLVTPIMALGFASRRARRIDQLEFAIGQPHHR